MGQEWRLYDVGGTRSSVGLLVTSWNLVLTVFREEHGIHTLTMVSLSSLTKPRPALILIAPSRRHHLPGVRPYFSGQFPTNRHPSFVFSL
jgi:hypothetical protein